MGYVLVNEEVPYSNDSVNVKRYPCISIADVRGVLSVCLAMLTK